MDSLLHGLKEALRVAILIVVSFALTEGIIGVLVDAVLGIKVDVSVKLVISAGVLAALKALDRELHDSGVAEKGIVRF